MGYRNAGWTFKDIEFIAEACEIKAMEQAQSNAMMMGRASYDAFSPVWPTMAEDFARYNAMPKFIVSTTMDEQRIVPDWGEIRILRSLDEVAALKARHEGAITIHGSATLSRNLSYAGPIDRFHLLVFPLLLGAGKRIFSEAEREKQMLKLVESRTYSNGVQKFIYDVVR